MQTHYHPPAGAVGRRAEAAQNATDDDGDNNSQSASPGPAVDGLGGLAS